MEAQEPQQTRLERFVDDQITAQHIADASRLFSLHYGVWGPLASTHLGKRARQGKRVQLSPVRLRRECSLPPPTSATGSVSPYMYAGSRQVVVHAAWRRRGIATAMLRLIHSATPTPTLPSTLFAILTSHAATLRACARAFKNGASLLDDGVLDPALIRRLAPPLVRGAPVKYVCEAEVRGGGACLMARARAAAGGTTTGWTRWWMQLLVFGCERRGQKKQMRKGSSEKRAETEEGIE
ncbi:hypothetical protein IWZ03DRAFT_405158 [Phyllosticta citriasiana]|uniref:N-acetyltransferase domain-containing protein n=1 Tax=Phyllosticta citriasiana TaxID=595635 RepID=A0ABR1KXC0_9PEZI